MSLGYVKTCHRNLQEAELIEQIRVGKSYGIEITDFGQAFLEQLPIEWGTDPVSQEGLDWQDPGAMVEVQERPNRRFKAGEQIKRSVWKAYYAAFLAGELDLAFVQPSKRIKLIDRT